MGQDNRNLDLVKNDFAGPVPPLIQYIASNEVNGFDSTELNSSLNNQYQASVTQPSSFSPLSIENEGTSLEYQFSEMHPVNHQRMHSISMPPSPLRQDFKDSKNVLSNEGGDAEYYVGMPDSCSAANYTANLLPNPVKYHSQPMPKGHAFEEAVEIQVNHPSITKLRDCRYDSFKTWSGKLEKQISHLRGKPQKDSPEDNAGQKEKEALPVDRYFDALEGPELETLKPLEEIVLPQDNTWPFLLRYPVSSFGICLGTSSQAILWKTLATSPATKFLHISPDVNLVLWCISIALAIIVTSIYLLKLLLYFEAVRREYYHPIRINFFFAPCIALLFLALGVPPSVTSNLPVALWYVLMTPILCLELKIYGQWMSGGQRRLSKVANPSNHLSIVGNFVGALLGASMGLKEGPIFFFAVGLAHYMVLFVTLYQRLPTNDTLPKELHPVFFLFVAAPSVASMAWAKIQGSFDYGSRIAYFIALFLYFSLAVRVNFFRGFKFSLAWWAYTFPMTGAAIATIRYSNQVTNVVTQALAVILSTASTLTVSALLVTTILHAFVLRDLFPNDIAIAITERKPKHNRLHKKWFHLTRHESADNVHNYLKYASSDCNDVEASPNPPSSEASNKEVK